MMLLALNSWAQVNEYMYFHYFAIILFANYYIISSFGEAEERKPGPSCSKHRYLYELVKGHFVNCFSRFNTQYSDIFCWKNVSSFCTAKATHIFLAKNFSIFAYHSM